MHGYIIAISPTERYMKHLIIGLALLASAFTVFATQEQLCTNLSIRAAEVQLKRQHREYDYVDRMDFVGYEHHKLVTQYAIYDTEVKDMMREQSIYIADSVYSRPYILNPTGLKLQVYHDCMLKNYWDHWKE